MDLLFKAFQKVYADPAIRADAEAAGTIVSLSTSPGEFTREIAADTARYERLVKATGLSTP